MSIKFKNDKITHEVNIIINSVNESVKNGEMSYLDAHNQIKYEICELYKNKDERFTYEDFVKRKNRITEFDYNLRSVASSILLGLLTSAIFDGAIDFMKWFTGEQLKLNTAMSIITYIIFFLFVSNTSFCDDNKIYFVLFKEDFRAQRF